MSVDSSSSDSLASKTSQQSLPECLLETLGHVPNGNFVPPTPNYHIVTRNWQGGQVCNVMKTEDKVVQAMDMSPKEEIMGDICNNNKTGGNNNNNNISRNSSKSTRTSSKRSNDKKIAKSLNDKVIENDDEKRKLRRERNKEAAARCRKKRVDQTMSLEKQTKEEKEKMANLETEVENLEKIRLDLEHMLVVHKNECKLHSRRHLLNDENGTKIPRSLPLSVSNPLTTSSETAAVPARQGAKRPTSLSVSIPKKEDSLVTPKVEQTPSGLPIDLDWASLPSTGFTPSGALPFPSLTPTEILTPRTFKTVCDSIKTEQVD